MAQSSTRKPLIDAIHQNKSQIDLNIKLMNKPLPPTFAIRLLAVAAFSVLSPVLASAQCDPPSNVQVTNVGATTAEVTWSASPSEPGNGYAYEVRTSGAPGSGVTPESGYVTSGNTVDGLLMTTVQDLDITTGYFFYVRYQCASLEYSAWTTAATFTTTAVQPPVALAAIYVSDDSFLARWNPSDGAANYYLDVSTDPSFNTFVTGYENLPVSITSAVVSDVLPSTTYYYRVRAIGATGPVTADSNVITVTTLATPLDYVVWTQAGWSGDPEYGLDAIIDWDYDTATDGDFVAETLTLNPGYTLTVAPFTSVGVANEIINNAGTGAIVVENNANLVQINDAAPANVGEITVVRNSSPIFRQDYTMWSSPVAGTQTLQDFSPLTVSTRFYTYDPATDFFNSTDPDEPFNQGAGYLIRVSNTHVDYVDETSVPEIWTGTFTGVPGNGLIEVPLSDAGQGFNMVGNPYPSVISAETLFQLNEENIEGTVYFWRRRNSTTSGDTNSYYATYTILGGVASETSDIPNGFIQVGQGFIVQALDGGGPLVFSNDERVPDNFEDQFFRQANPAAEKHRMWLTLTNESGGFSQMLLGYMEGALDDVDRMDGKYIGDGSLALTSWLAGAEYTIQGRALPFDQSDVVPLHFKSPYATSHTISLSSFDGLFEELPSVYLRDNYTGAVHDLKVSAYTFETDAGAFADRFEILFAPALGVDVAQDTGCMITSHNGRISFQTGGAELSRVALFDMQGRQVFESPALQAQAYVISDVANRGQILVAKVTLGRNVIYKKIVY
jgi:hypothetical protein